LPTVRSGLPPIRIAPASENVENDDGDQTVVVPAEANLNKVETEGVQEVIYKDMPDLTELGIARESALMEQMYEEEKEEQEEKDAEEKEVGRLCLSKVLSDEHVREDEVHEVHEAPQPWHAMRSDKATWLQEVVSDTKDDLIMEQLLGAERDDTLLGDTLDGESSRIKDGTEWLAPREPEVVTAEQSATPSEPEAVTGCGGATSSTAPSPSRHRGVEVGGTFQVLKGGRIWKLSCRESFNTLSPKQKKYVSRLNAAAWACARVVLGQTSPESLKLAELFLLVCSGNSCDKVKPGGAVTEVELASFYDYLVKFWANLGNYDVETGWKFVPHMKPEAFEKVVVRHACFLQGIGKRNLISELLEELINPIFSLQEEDRQGHCLPRSAGDCVGLDEVLQALRSARSIAPDKTHLQVLDDLMLRLEASSDSTVDEQTFSAEISPVEVDVGFRSVGRSQGDAIPGDSIYHQLSDALGELTALLALRVVPMKITKAVNRIFSVAKELQEELPWPEAFNEKSFSCPELHYLDVVSFVSPSVASSGWVNLPLRSKDHRYPGRRGRHFLLRNVVAAMAGDDEEPFVPACDNDLSRHIEQSCQIQAALEALTSCSGCIFHSVDVASGCVLDPLSQSPITKYYADDENWEVRFGALAEVLETCRQIAGGLYLCVSDLLDDMCDDAERNEVAACIWLRVVRSGLGALASRRAPAIEPSEGRGWGLASRARARFSILATLVNAGEDMVRFDASHTTKITVTLDRKQIYSTGREALRRLLEKLQVFKSTGDVEEATRFFDELTSVSSAEWQDRHEVVQKMMARLQPICVQAHLEEGSDGQVDLREFQGTAKGMILSMQYHLGSLTNAARRQEQEREPHRGEESSSNQKGKHDATDAKAFSRVKGSEKGRGEYAHGKGFSEKKGSEKGKGIRKYDADEYGKGKDGGATRRKLDADGHGKGKDRADHEATRMTSSYASGKGKATPKHRMRKIANLAPDDRGFNVIVKTLKIRMLLNGNSRRADGRSIEALVGDSSAVIQMRCTEEQALLLQYKGPLLIRGCRIYMDFGHMKLEVEPGGTIEEAVLAPDFKPLRNFNLSVPEYEYN